MARFCRKCGTPLEDNAKVCQNCGAVFENFTNNMQNNGQKKMIDLKSRVLFWENSELGTEEIKKLMRMKIIGGVGYLFIFLTIWLPWLSVSIKGSKITVSYSFKNLLDEMMNDNMYHLLKRFTVFFILLSIVFFVLGFARISIACMVLSWIPKLLLLLKCVTDFSRYRYFPSYGMVLGIIGFAAVSYTAIKSKEILRWI